MVNNTNDLKRSASSSSLDKGEPPPKRNRLALGSVSNEFIIDLTESPVTSPRQRTGDINDPCESFRDPSHSQSSNVKDAVIHHSTPSVYEQVIKKLANLDGISENVRRELSNLAFFHPRLSIEHFDKLINAHDNHQLNYNALVDVNHYLGQRKFRDDMDVIENFFSCHLLKYCTTQEYEKIRKCCNFHLAKKMDPIKQRLFVDSKFNWLVDKVIFQNSDEEKSWGGNSVSLDFLVAAMRGPNPYVYDVMSNHNNKVKAVLDCIDSTQCELYNDDFYHLSDLVLAVFLNESMETQNNQMTRDELAFNAVKDKVLKLFDNLLAIDSSKLFAIMLTFDEESDPIVPHVSRCINAITNDSHFHGCDHLTINDRASKLQELNDDLLEMEKTSITRKLFHTLQFLESSW